MVADSPQELARVLRGLETVEDVEVVKANDEVTYLITAECVPYLLRRKLANDARIERIDPPVNATFEITEPR